jgi:hypothetical protein
MPSIRNPINGQYVGHETEINSQEILDQIYKPFLFEDCWWWLGRKRSDGYGVIFKPKTSNHRKSSLLVHRWVYEYYNGPIPPKLQLHHICKNKICVNPDHLEMLTIQVHLKKGNSPSTINSKKTHCIHGHSLKNSYIENVKGQNRQKRHCFICRKQYEKQYYLDHRRLKGGEDGTNSER